MYELEELKPSVSDATVYKHVQKLVDAAVVDAVRTAQPVSVTALAERADLAPNTASYHVSRLTDADVFEREKTGRVRVSLSADAARLLGNAPGGTQ